MPTYKLNYVPTEAFPPGEFLADELKARNLSVKAFAKQCGVDAQSIEAFIHNERDMTEQEALQIGNTLQVGNLFWNLQRSYYEDLQKMKHTSQQHKHTIMPTLQRITKAIYRNLIL